MDETCLLYREIASFSRSWDGTGTVSSEQGLMGNVGASAVSIFQECC